MPVQPLVSICCVAYNQKEYLKQAMDGFLMQKTEYPFEILVHDDASTDGTTQLIAEYAAKYPELIRPIYQKENQYQKGADIWKEYVLPQVRATYVAFCDGDDYWIDENKLQRQLSYLETHPECPCVFHAVKYVDGSDRQIRIDQYKKTETLVPIQKIIEEGGLFCSTASLCCRTEYAREYRPFRLMADVADYPLQITLALHGSFFYLPEPMACYRVHTTGSWTQSVDQDREKNRKHLENEIRWLQEFDKETGMQYHQWVYYRIILFQLRLYKEKLQTGKQIRNSLGQMMWTRQKLRALWQYVRHIFIRWLKWNFYGLYDYAKKVKQYRRLKF